MQGLGKGIGDALAVGVALGAFGVFTTVVLIVGAVLSAFIAIPVWALVLTAILVGVVGSALFIAWLN